MKLHGFASSPSLWTSVIKDVLMAEYCLYSLTQSLLDAKQIIQLQDQMWSKPTYFSFLERLP